ncbi:MAG TPA: hypothetical protein VMB71_08025 [Acetobacteraceae bacterium]|nr:hypothetical protein [Acetobacteraceae bacterium]
MRDEGEAMRNAVAEKRPVDPETGQSRRRVSAVLGTFLRRTAAGALFCGSLAAAQSLHYGDPQRPLDPLFNLPYDPAHVHFDSIPLSNVAQCAPLLGSLGQGTGRAKLFGQLVNGRRRVVIIGDEDPRTPRGLSGTVLVMHGGNCRSSGPLFALRRAHVSDPDLDPGLSASDVSLLMRDVLTRYARAFGSKTAFLAWADRLTMEAETAYSVSPNMPCPLLYTSMFTPPMLHVLDDFRRS